jgi:hypothetical protein
MTTRLRCCALFVAGRPPRGWAELDLPVSFLWMEEGSREDYWRISAIFRIVN